MNKNNSKGLKQVEEKLKYEDMSPELKRQYNKHKEHLLVSLSQLEMAGMEGEIKEKKQTVINGFKNGLEIKMISNITQLSEEEVIKILKEEGLMK